MPTLSHNAAKVLRILAIINAFTLQDMGVHTGYCSTAERPNIILGDMPVHLDKGRSTNKPGIEI